jgi:hypothetical protein
MIQLPAQHASLDIRFLIMYALLVLPFALLVRQIVQELVLFVLLARLHDILVVMVLVLAVELVYLS